MVYPSIFREYIAAKPDTGLPDFPDIINPGVTEFHYVLAFATEKGNGIFNPEWDLSIYSAENILKLKNKHGNAKVIISIGGRGHDSQNPFNPTVEKLTWIENAKKSLRKIIEGFYDPSRCHKLIDGIDVYYENIINTNDFVDSIGELIKSLKEGGHIKEASIGPSNAFHLLYRDLYQTYRDYIDWVDYKFYDQRVSNKEEFLNIYTRVSADYPNAVLVAGFSTDRSDEGMISKDVFLDGCKDLIKRNLLHGISVWDLNSMVEIVAQQMLVDP